MTSLASLGDLGMGWTVGTVLCEGTRPMTSLASLGDLGMGRTVGTELCEGTPRVVRGLRESCVRGPLG